MPNSKELHYYFQYPNSFLSSLVIFGLYILVMTMFWPQAIPLYFGPLRGFAIYISEKHPTFLTYLFYFAWAMHVMEAGLMLKLCRIKRISREATIKWCIQTVIVGFPSLLTLLSHKPPAKVKQ